MKKVSIILFVMTLTLFAQDELILLTSVHGEKDGDAFSNAAVLGDVNGDGFDDFIVGSQRESYSKLFFGGNPFDTLNCIRFQSHESFTSFNASFGGDGDLNGDGYKDFVLGAYYDMFNLGKVFIHFGGPTIDTAAHLTITGQGYYYFFGAHIAINGDLNGDGFDDLVISAPNDDYDAHGRVYIYFGGNEMDTICDVFIEGKEQFDMLGRSVSIIGDANRDGFDDLLIGAPQDKNGKGGKAYLFWGGENIGFNNAIEFIGATKLAYNSYGRIVSGLGDINGDGYDDFGIMSISYIDLFSGRTLDVMLKHKYNSETKDFWFIGGLSDLNNDGYYEYAYVNKQINFLFGNKALDTIPQLHLDYWGMPILNLGDINGDGKFDIAVGSSFGEKPRGTVFIYSYGKLNGIEDTKESTLSTDYKLYQNYPNPFNPTTTISYTLPEDGKVQIKIFDVLGREVAILIDGFDSKGKHSIIWNGSNGSSGIYFYSITFKNQTINKKMLMLK